jgi:hypothetical protein
MKKIIVILIALSLGCNKLDYLPEEINAGDIEAWMESETLEDIDCTVYFRTKSTTKVLLIKDSNYFNKVYLNKKDTVEMTIINNKSAGSEIRLNLFIDPYYKMKMHAHKYMVINFEIKDNKFVCVK